MLAADLSLALDSLESPPAEFLQTTHFINSTIELQRRHPHANKSEQNTKLQQQRSEQETCSKHSKASKIQTATKTSEQESYTKHTQENDRLQQRTLIPGTWQKKASGDCEW